MKAPTYGTNALAKHGLPAWRSRFVLVAMLLGMTGMLVRAGYLQGVQQDFLQKKGEARYEREIKTAGVRGQILDRNGDLLAVSTPLHSVWTDTSLSSDITPPQLRRLASILNIPVNDLARRIGSGKHFVYLSRQIPDNIADAIKAMKLPGINFQTEYGRTYPEGPSTSHLLGFTNVDGIGREGIELAFDEQLSGSQGMRRVIKDLRGRIVDDAEVERPSTKGEDLHLTIDRNIQFLAYRELKKAIAENNALSGSVVVLDVETGGVLAMSSAPDYDPNDTRSRTPERVRNRAVTDAFEPGSVVKPFTVALALEQGRVTPNTMIDASAGFMKIGSARISDAHRHGKLTVAQVIEKSSNIGAAEIGLQLKPEDMWTFFTDLGFGRKQGLKLRGESPGLLHDYHRWKPIEQATMSYGHGLSVTAMQIAAAYLCLARDGVCETPHLIKGVAPMSGPHRLFSSKTAQQVRAMLAMAVSSEGTGQEARVPGYRIGGKTGTARKPVGGVYVKKYISSFVGIAPIDAPRIVVAVVIDEPRNEKYYGGAVSGPAFSAITGGALRVLNVTPQAPEDFLQNVKRESAPSNDLLAGVVQ